MNSRKVILHFHLFKNAGTSIDELLSQNFPGRCSTREFEGGSPQARTALQDWLASDREAVAFSSHTAELPPPPLEGVEIFPILFVRHPIDRIASIHAFEKRQTLDNFGASLARGTDLSDYIEARLAIPGDRQCRNFHVARLGRMFPKASGKELERALRALEELPFVGLVDAFEASVKRMSNWLKPHFAGFKGAVLQRNVSRDRSLPLQRRLEAIRNDIGERLWALLLEANRQDLIVFDAVARQYLDRASYAAVLRAMM